MKKIYQLLLLTSLFFCLGNYSLHAQCTAAIDGTPCIGSTLTANFTGGLPDTVKWFKDGILQLVRTKRNPVYAIAAGGGNSDAGQLFGPQDVYVDGDGNIYVVDGNRYRVQKWKPGADTGITVAGNNGKGTGLNQFFAPQGVYADNLGNVYVSDALMNRITKWAPGTISGVIVAGGNGEGGAANQLNGPQNFCVDGTGNIYIADRWNHRVQKWAPGAITGTTVAGGNGSGSAANQLIEPLDVAIDANNNLYIVDYYNYRVQKWVPGAITGITVAGGNGYGSAANQFKFTTAISVTSNGTIYVRDQDNYRIQKWVSGTPYGITVAGGNGSGGSGGGQNTIGPGFGLYADEFENIYVPELFGNTVNKFIPAAVADIQYIAPTTGNYIAGVSGENGCIAQSPVFTVITAPAQPARIFGPGFVNALQTEVIFRVKKNPNNSYSWTVPADAVITGGQGTNGIRVNWGFSDGQVTVAETNACGSSPIKKRRVLITAVAKLQDKTQLNSGVQYSDLKVYPNPVQTTTLLHYNSIISAKLKIELADIYGNVLMKKNMASRKGSNNTMIDLSDFAQGIYTIKLTDEKGITSTLKCTKL